MRVHGRSPEVGLGKTCHWRSGPGRGPSRSSSYAGPISFALGPTRRQPGRTIHLAPRPGARTRMIAPPGAFGVENPIVRYLRRTRLRFLHGVSTPRYDGFLRRIFIHSDALALRGGARSDTLVHGDRHDRRRRDAGRDHGPGRQSPTGGGHWGIVQRTATWPSRRPTLTSFMTRFIERVGARSPP